MVKITPESVNQYLEWQSLKDKVKRFSVGSDGNVLFELLLEALAEYADEDNWQPQDTQTWKRRESGADLANSTLEKIKSLVANDSFDVGQ